MVLESLGSGEIAQKLLVSHANLLGRTAEDLQRYALRHDALRRYLTSEEERRASQLALLLLAPSKCHLTVGHRRYLVKMIECCEAPIQLHLPENWCISALRYSGAPQVFAAG
jgi:hypothetical protein